jgi:DNA-binding GntR family transcriptional regulator
METKTRKPTAVQLVIETILSRIQEGKYIPGQYLIAGDLMEELNLSKAPVREAIHVLVGEGIIELLQNRSARIRNLSMDEMIDFSEVWAAVGGVNVRLAADYMHLKGNKSRVRKALKPIVLSEKTKNGEDYFRSVSQFHLVLSDITGNQYITQMIKRANFSHFYRHISALFPGTHWRRHIVAFSKIAEAIIAGKGDTAERIYRKHMQWVIVHLKSAINQI